VKEGRLYADEVAGGLGLEEDGMTKDERVSVSDVSSRSTVPEEARLVGKITEWEGIVQGYNRAIVNEQTELAKLKASRSMQTFKMPEGYETLGVDSTGRILGITEPIVLTHKKLRLQLGRWRVVVDFGKLEVHAFPLGRRNTGFTYHPHVNCEGHICWGSATADINRALDKGDLRRALELAYIALRVYTPEGGPFVQLDTLISELASQGEPWCIEYILLKDVCSRCSLVNSIYCATICTVRARNRRMSELPAAVLCAKCADKGTLYCADLCGRGSWWPACKKCTHTKTEVEACQINLRPRCTERAKHIAGQLRASGSDGAALRTRMEAMRSEIRRTRNRKVEGFRPWLRKFDSLASAYASTRTR